jgi:HEAT repeat protein
MLTSDLSGEARIAAVRALAALGPAAKPALNALETAQTSKTADIRLWAVVAQARATNELGAAVSTLTDEIQAKKALSPVKAAAVLAMANLAADNPKALQVVIDAAADPSPFLRLAAAEGLASLGTQEAAITTLILLTRDKDDRVRQAAIVALGQIGPPAEAAAGRLRDLIARMDDLAAFAQAALERIAPERP